MREESGQQETFSRLCGRLEGGTIAHTRPGEALSMPSGTIHEVWTTQGGFLVSTDFQTRECIWPSSQYLKHGLHRDLDAQGRREFFFMFLWSLDLSLQNDRLKLAWRAWGSVDDILQAETKEDDEWRSAAHQVWQTAIEQYWFQDTVCVCGATSGGSYWDHFLDSHVSWLRGRREKPGGHPRKRRKVGRSR